MAHLQQGHFGFLPHEVFSISEVTQAFEYMAQARHIGKILISLTDQKAVEKLSTPKKGLPLTAIIGSSEERQFEEQTIITSAPAQSDDESSHDRAGLTTVYSAPRNEIENTLAQIWQTLLGISKIGRQDNFFDLNGDSLLAAQVISRLHQIYNINLPMSSLFDNPKLASLAQQIEKRLASSKASGISNRISEYEEEGEI